MVRIVVSTAAALLVSIAASAQTRYLAAEVTGGSFNADTSTPMLRASYDLTGAGFHFVASGVEPGVVDAAIACTAPGCRPGDVVSLSGTFTGSYLGTGVAVVDAATLTPAFFTGSLTFAAAPVVIPNGHRRSLVLTVPFTLAGVDGAYPELSAWADGRGVSGAPWTVAALTGGGTATAFFRRDEYAKGAMPERFYYVLERVIYSFGTAEAVEDQRGGGQQR